MFAPGSAPSWHWTLCYFTGLSAWLEGPECGPVPRSWSACGLIPCEDSSPRSLTSGPDVVRLDCVPLRDARPHSFQRDFVPATPPLELCIAKSTRAGQWLSEITGDLTCIHVLFPWVNSFFFPPFILFKWAQQNNKGDYEIRHIMSSASIYQIPRLFPDWYFCCCCEKEKDDWRTIFMHW